MKRLRHLIEYYFLRAVVEALALPPRAISRRLGAGLGLFIHALRIRRAVVDENIAKALPELSAERRAEIARDCYRHFATAIIDLASVHNWSENQIKAEAILTDQEKLNGFLKLGKGLVVATGHLGVVDIGPARLQYEFPDLISIYQSLRNPYVDGYISAIRSIGRARTTNARLGLRQAFRMLERKGMVLILADQDAGRNGLFLPFLGRPASTLIGPAELALRTGAILITGFIIAEGDKFFFHVEEPIPHSTVPEMMAEYNRRLERAIQKWPEQYFWLHKRWKSVPREPSSLPR